MARSSFAARPCKETYAPTLGILGSVDGRTGSGAGSRQMAQWEIPAEPVDSTSIATAAAAAVAVAAVAAAAAEATRVSSSRP